MFVLMNFNDIQKINIDFIDLFVAKVVLVVFYELQTWYVITLEILECSYPICEFKAITFQ